MKAVDGKGTDRLKELLAECLNWTHSFLAIPEGSATNITPEMRLVAQTSHGVHLPPQRTARRSHFALLGPPRSCPRASARPGPLAYHQCNWGLAYAHRLSLLQLKSVSELCDKREQIKQFLKVDPPAAIGLLEHLANAHLEEHE